MMAASWQQAQATEDHGLPQVLRIAAATSPKLASSNFPSAGQIRPKPSRRHRGTMCRCRWKTVCSAVSPADVMRFMPSGFKAVSIARPTRIAAIMSSLASEGGSTLHRSGMCFLGIIRVWPGVAGSRGKKATQSFPSHTTSAVESSPLAISQNGHSMASPADAAFIALRPWRPSQSMNRGCCSRRPSSRDRRDSQQESFRTAPWCCHQDL